MQDKSAASNMQTAENTRVGSVRCGESEQEDGDGSGRALCRSLWTGAPRNATEHWASEARRKGSFTCLKDVGPGTGELRGGQPMGDDEQHQRGRLVVCLPNRQAQSSFKPCAICGGPPAQPLVHGPRVTYAPAGPGGVRILPQRCSAERLSL